MDNHFPEGFLWGSSTSAYQVEGDNRLSDWWRWEQTGAIEPSGKACEHYNRFCGDFRIARELGHNAHRLGLEWSRLEKDDGVWDMKEWDHYKEVLDELRSLDITPVLTLNHFTVPVWFADKGSWLNERSVAYFTRFAEKAIKELGDRVEYWITLNEPHMLAFIPYFYGQWTPCVKDPEAAFTVLINQLKAHCAAYGKMHETAAMSSGGSTPRIGIAKAVGAFHPASSSEADIRSAEERNILHNHSFISSAIKGRVDIAGFTEEELACADSMDFIGLNYYYRQFINSAESWKESPLGGTSPSEGREDAGMITDMGWEVYPPGIYEVAADFRRYDKPLIITENGIATRNDHLRENYIREHLAELLRAIAGGAPVVGYLHWSLLDNFEWSCGYTKRFGLVEVDLETQRRTIRDSARYYASVIKTGRI